MSVFKCFFDFDNGATIESKTKYVFLNTDELSEERIKNLVQKYLELKLFNSNDCLITNLKIIGTECYDGLVI